MPTSTTSAAAIVKATPAVAALTEQFKHQDLWLRIEAAEALAAIGKPAMNTVPQLLRMLAEVDATPALMKILLSYGTQGKTAIPELQKITSDWDKGEPDFEAFKPEESQYRPRRMRAFSLAAEGGTVCANAGTHCRQTGQLTRIDIILAQFIEISGCIFEVCIQARVSHLGRGG